MTMSSILPCTGSAKSACNLDHGLVGHVHGCIGAVDRLILFARYFYLFQSTRPLCEQSDSCVAPGWASWSSSGTVFCPALGTTTQLPQSRQPS